MGLVAFSVLMIIIWAFGKWLMATLRAFEAAAKGRTVVAEMVARGVGVGVTTTALSVDSGVGVGVGKSIIVGVGVGVIVVLCCSRVWVTSPSCLLSCWDWEKRKTVMARATPLMRSRTMAIKEPKADPPLGVGTVAGAGSSTGSWTGGVAVG